MEATGVTEMSLQGAVGIWETQTRQGAGHPSMSSCPVGSPNKVVEPGGNWLIEGDGLNRCLC